MPTGLFFSFFGVDVVRPTVYMNHHVPSEVTFDTAPLGAMRTLELRFLSTTLITLVAHQVALGGVRTMTLVAVEPLRVWWVARHCIFSI